MAGLIGVVLLAPVAVLACPTCKDAVGGDPVATALSATTLLLLSMPVLLVGSIGGWVGYVYWRAARRAAVQEEPAATEGASQPL